VKNWIEDGGAVVEMRKKAYAISQAAHKLNGPGLTGRKAPTPSSRPTNLQKRDRCVTCRDQSSSRYKTSGVRRSSVSLPA
jgi:hypothetical protein